MDAAGRPLNPLCFGDWGLPELLRFRVICQPAVFMRRTVLEQAGWLDPSYHFLLDHQLWIRMAALAPMVYIGGLDADIVGADRRVGPHASPPATPSSGDHASPSARATADPTTGAHGRSSAAQGAPLQSYLPLAGARHHAAAKNLTMAARAGAEIERVLAWMATQPHLQPLLAGDRAHITGGAYRLNARYLLEGGLPGPALRMYLRALRCWPAYTLKHTHRMLYALLSLARLQGPLDARQAARAAHSSRRLAEHLRQAWPTELAGDAWPGIRLDP
jgi:hypothetical protein